MIDLKTLCVVPANGGRSLAITARMGLMGSHTVHVPRGEAAAAGQRILNAAAKAAEMEKNGE